MAGLRALLLVASAIALAAARADAATVTWPGGKQEVLEVGREITGPAVVTSADGKDVIRLRPGAILRCLGEEIAADGSKAESFFLKSGAADADVGFFTRVSTTAFWAVATDPKGRVVFHAEGFPGGRGYARAAKESGTLRLLVVPGTPCNREGLLGPDQGALVALEKDGLRITTDADNDWRNGSARVLFPLAEGRFLDAYVPKATEAAILSLGTNRVLVANGLSSWRGGRIRLITAVGEKRITDGEVGPGAAASLDPATGTFADPGAGAAKAATPLRLLPGAGTAAGGSLQGPGGAPVVVLAVRLEPAEKRARFVLRNDGPALPAFSAEAAFLLPTGAGSAAPFLPAFVPVEIADWKAGEQRVVLVDLPAGGAVPLDAMLLAPAPGDLPLAAAREPSSLGVRRGTLLLGGRIEVVKVEGDLLGDKPWVAITLENALPAGSDAPAGDLHWELRLRRPGADDGPVKSGTVALGKAGERAVLRVEGLEPAGSLAGAQPILTLSK